MRLLNYIVYGALGITQIGCAPKVNDLRIDENTSPEYFLCFRCNLTYESQSLAKRCDTWCRDNDSCNVEVASQSLEARGINGN